MGQQLAKFYEAAKQAGGLQAQMRLAMKTGLSAEKAQAAPDSPENVAKFKAAIKEITGKEVSVA